MRGRCACGNIQVRWHTIDYSVVPRACQCAYCQDKGAAYVSKSATRVDVNVAKRQLLTTFRHGSNMALFHECTNCGDLVFASVEIDGIGYAALNAHCMANPLGFGAAITRDFSSDSIADKLDRWQGNWCYPLTVSYGA